MPDCCVVNVSALAIASFDALFLQLPTPPGAVFFHPPIDQLPYGPLD